MWKAKQAVLLFGDIILLYVSLALALFLRYGGDFSSRFGTHIFPFTALFILWLFVFYLADLYRPTIFSTRKKLFRILFQSLLIAGIVSMVLLYLFQGFFQLTPKTNLLMTGIFFFLLDGAFRLLFLHAFSVGSIRVRFFGSSELKTEITNLLNSNPHIGYAFESWSDTPTDSEIQALYRAGKDHENAIAVVTPGLIRNPDVSRKIYGLLSGDVKVVSLVDFYEEIFERAPLELIEPDWFIERVSFRRPFYDLAKRAADVVSALALSLILLPLGILIAIFIPLTSRGPVFYSERRVGKNGEPLMLRKFRSMVDRAWEKGPAWTEVNDSRVTGFGKFLRYTHLDEIPQLLNILAGDISFTGPRPEAATLAEKYRTLPFYDMRHSVKPGLTGWAQINYRPSASLEEAQEKLRYDIFYIKNRSFFLDILIMLRTVKHFFFSHE